MKKGLLAGLLGVAAVGLGIAGYFVFGRDGSQETAEPDTTRRPEKYIEVGVEESPFVSITPSTDGHWLKIKIEGIKDAEELEYELAYETADGVSQGAIGGPYSVPEDGSYEKEILLGTESSGHYRFHEGVEGGSLTVRLLGGVGARKFVADFVLTNEEPFASADGQFTVETAKFDGWVVVMPTFGLPEVPEAGFSGQPYGVFSPGSVEIDLGDLNWEKEQTLVWNGKRWIENVQAVFGLSMAFVQK